MLLLEQADLLVSKGVGEWVRARCGVLVRRTRGGPGWRRHGAAAKRRRIADGRGWAVDVDADVKGTRRTVGVGERN